MNAPFSIGQKVVRTGKTIQPVKKGETYTVTDIKKCGCGEWRIALDEDKRHYGNEYECQRCGSATGDVAYMAKYFAPIQTNYADATAEIIEKFKPTEDTPDKILIPEKLKSIP